MKRDFDKILKARGLHIVDGEYCGTKQKMHLVDDDGYEYSLSLDTIADKRTKTLARFAKTNAYTLKNLRNFIKLNNL